MGILTNALDQIVGQLIGTGFNQLDEYFTRKAEAGQMEEAAREAAETDNVINQKLLMMQNVNQGTFGVPGIGDTTGQNVNPRSPQGQGILSQLGTLPEIPAGIAQSPLHAGLVEHRGKQFIDQSPIVQQMKQQQDIQKEILRASGQKVDQNLIGMNELEPTFRNPSLLPRDRILQNLAEREFTETTGTEKAKEPFKDAQLQRQITLKQTKTAKQLHGGEEKPKKPKELSRSNLKNIYAGMQEYSAMQGTDPGYFKETDEGKFVPTKEGNWVAARAKHYMSAEHLGEVSAVERAVQDWEERQQSPEIQKQKQRERRIQAPNASRFMENAPATPSIPTTPAPQQRAAGVRTGRDPATESKIKTAKSLGATDAEIKQSLIDEGKNPADYGYR